MNMTFKTVKIILLNLVVCIGLATMAIAVDREVYDKPLVQQLGKTIHGKVVKVDERDAKLQRWVVSVQNSDTGEVVALHVDKNTTRTDSQLGPAVGANVLVKYDERSKYASSMLADTPTSH